MRIGEISSTDHELFIQESTIVSPLQTPDWAGVKPTWEHQKLGWFNENDSLSGAALVLSQPKTHKDPIAYIPEGPLVHWDPETVESTMSPLLAHLGRTGIAAVKMDPRLALRSWSADTIKRAIADPNITSLRQVPADESYPDAIAVEEYLLSSGWQPDVVEPGSYGKSQPKFVYQLPLKGDSDQVFSGFSTQWRRNIRKSEKYGVEVTKGGAELLPEFTSLYAETAQRDGFTGRPTEYFETMYTSMTGTDPERMQVYVARHEDVALAAAIKMTVGKHAWYMYGASSSQRREVQASTAVQWQMIQDACTRGVETYDFRGITDAVDGSHHQGVLQFKLGAADGKATEYIGAWTYPFVEAR